MGILVKDKYIKSNMRLTPFFFFFFFWHFTTSSYYPSMLMFTFGMNKYFLLKQISQKKIITVISKMDDKQCEFWL